MYCSQLWRLEVLDHGVKNDWVRGLFLAAGPLVGSSQREAAGELHGVYFIRH